MASDAWLFAELCSIEQVRPAPKEMMATRGGQGLPEDCIHSQVLRRKAGRPRYVFRSAPAEMSQDSANPEEDQHSADAGNGKAGEEGGGEGVIDPQKLTFRRIRRFGIFMEAFG